MLAHLSSKKIAEPLADYQPWSGIIALQVFLFLERHIGDLGICLACVTSFHDGTKYLTISLKIIAT